MEAGNLAGELGGLFVQRPHGAPGRFGGFGVQPAGLVHLGQGFARLRHALGLLPAGGSERCDQGVDFGDPPGHAPQRLAAAPHQLGAQAGLGRAFAEQGLDLAARIGGPLGQGAHLLGHNGEAAPGLARPRRLHTSVQRQEIGLKRDLVDHGHHLGHLLRRAFDRRHGGQGLAQDRIALVRLDPGGPGGCGGVASAGGGLLQRLGDIAEP